MQQSSQYCLKKQVMYAKCAHLRTSLTNAEIYGRFDSSSNPGNLPSRTRSNSSCALFCTSGKESMAAKNVLIAATVVSLAPIGGNIQSMEVEIGMQKGDLTGKDDGCYILNDFLAVFRIEAADQLFRPM